MRSRRPLGRRFAVVAVVSGFLASGLGTLGASYAAFSSTTSNGTNQVAAGSVVLSDDDGGSSMFTTGTVGTNQVSGFIKPGGSVVNCVKVTFTGTLASTVKIYFTSVTDTLGTASTGLQPYLHVKIEESSAGTFGCGSFGTATTIWDTSTHPGVASDLINVFPTTYAAGLTTNQAVWNTSTARSFRFTMTLDSATPDTSQGAQVNATINWQAQNN